MNILVVPNHSKMILLFLLLEVCLLINASKLETVKIPNGKIQGSVDTSYNGRKFIKFEGIPYAKPPIGKLRFEDPQIMSDWYGTWVANFTTACLQIAHEVQPEGGSPLGEEDCLYVNIYVPGDKINSNDKLDVIVHIHGGAFMFGKSTYYAQPKYLMDRDVILVTMNYRLGVFGYLSTEDENLPGNLGMKDQSFALKWTKDNIQHFGGNPESITISGLSAGGASVHLHYFSPLSKDLFKQGISVSGCALNNWVLVEDSLKQTQKIAKEVGCYDESTSIMVKCLKTRSGIQLNEAVKKLRIWLYNPYSPLGVVVDKWSKNPFLPEHPYKLLKEGKVMDVPWIASASTSEGLYPGADFAVENKYLPDLEKNWLKYAPAIMHYMDSVPENMKNHISLRAKEHYLGNKSISKETYLPLIQMLGDRLFVADMEKSARLQANVNRSPVYYYQFDYDGEKVPSIAHLVTHHPEKFGVCHGDDVLFIFSYTQEDHLPRMTRNDESMKEFLINFWISFAKTSKPEVPNWTPISSNLKDDFKYLYVNSNREIRTTKELGHRSFWDSLPFAENHNLFTDYVKDEL